MVHSEVFLEFQIGMALRDETERQVSLKFSAPQTLSATRAVCIVQVQGLAKEIREEVYGLDPVHAFQLALSYANERIRMSDEFLSGTLRPISGNESLESYELASVFVR